MKPSCWASVAIATGVDANSGFLVVCSAVSPAAVAWMPAMADVKTATPAGESLSSSGMFNAQGSELANHSEAIFVRLQAARPVGQL